MAKVKTQILTKDTAVEGTVVISECDAKQRLDLFLSSQFEQYSRAKIQKFIADKCVFVNGDTVKSSYMLCLNDRVDFKFEQLSMPTNLQAKPLDLDVLYEDDYLIVINKQAGIVVHPGAGTRETTLAEGVLHRVVGGMSQKNSFRPGIVHRLDKDTSGAIVCAKNDFVHEALAKQFRDKTNLREYVALLNGYMQQDTLSFSSYLVRDPKSRVKFMSIYNEDEVETPKKGRFAKSHFRKISSYSHRLTFASVRLETGRTHQIRVHSQDLKMPVVGDPLYSNRAMDLGGAFDKAAREVVANTNRQLLHAKFLGFEHPISGKKIAFEAPLPEDFKKILDILQKFKDN